MLQSEVDLRDDEDPSDAGAVESDTGAANDAFLAELRRAVTDDKPLGPRPEEHVDAHAADDDEEIDFYERDREASGRIASRLRRRR